MMLAPGELKWLAVGLCCVGAAIVAARGKDGWGWFLFVAFLLGTISTA